MMNYLKPLQMSYSYSMVLFGVFLVVLIVWAIIDCLNSKRKDIEKLIWIIIIFSLNVIGVAIYFMIAKRGITMAKNTKKLFRSKKNKMIAGVCGGLGEYLEVDPTVVRLIWVLFALTGSGILAYIVAWIIIPESKH